MNSERSFQSLLKKARSGVAFWVSRAKEKFAEDIFAMMEDEGISKSELASRLGKSPAYVTKILRGQSNFTIESMVVLARTLDAEVDIRVKKVRPVVLAPENETAYEFRVVTPLCKRPDTVLSPEKISLHELVDREAA